MAAYACLNQLPDLGWISQPCMLQICEVICCPLMVDADGGALRMAVDVGGGVDILHSYLPYDYLGWVFEGIVF